MPKKEKTEKYVASISFAITDNDHVLITTNWDENVEIAKEALAKLFTHIHTGHLCLLNAQDVHITAQEKGMPELTTYVLRFCENVLNKKDDNPYVRPSEVLSGGKQQSD